MALTGRMSLGLSQRGALSTEPARLAVVDALLTGDACPLFPGKRYEEWPVADPEGRGVEDVRPIRDDIERRVRNLLGELELPVGSAILP